MKRRDLLALPAAIAAVIGLPRGLSARAIAASEAIAASDLARIAMRGLLPTGYFVPAKMPLNANRVVLPRPDAETHTRAFHRNAHVDMPYVLPIVVQGGAWPFVFELLDAPAGARIGSANGDIGYGVVEWTPAAPGPFAFRVRVTDQDLSTAVVEWSGTVGSDWVRFVDPVKGSDAGDGSVAAPWQSLDFAYANVTDGRTLCLREGVHSAPSNDSFNLSTSHTASLIGWPGEQPQVDCSVMNAAVFGWLNSSDTYMAGFTLSGGPVNVANPRYFSSLSVNHRCYQYGLVFDNPAAGTSSGGGDDNNSCLFLGRGDSQRRYAAQVGCTFRRLRRTNNGFSGIDTYRTRYLVVADNVYDTPTPGPTSRMALWIKGGEQEDISIRNNRWTQAWTGDSLLNLYMAAESDVGLAVRNLEACFNTVVAENTALRANIAVLIAQADQPGPRGPLWFYRNTVRGIVAINKRDYDLELQVENDVIVHDAVAFEGPGPSGNVLMIDVNDPGDRFRDPAIWPRISLQVSGIECHGSTVDQIIDGSHLLQGEWRELYLGRRGAEIHFPGTGVFGDGFESL